MTVCAVGRGRRRLSYGTCPPRHCDACRAAVAIAIARAPQLTVARAHFRAGYRELM